MGDKSVPVAKKGGGGAKHTPPYPLPLPMPCKRFKHNTGDVLILNCFFVVWNKQTYFGNTGVPMKTRHLPCLIYILIDNVNKSRLGITLEFI